MPLELKNFIRDLVPEQTILLFGAGASIPSGAPSVNALIEHLSKKFQIKSDGFNLADFSELVQKRCGERRILISELRSLYQNLKPTGGILNLPLYDWKSIFSTNYDELVESVYARRQKDLSVYSSNYDFTAHGKPATTKLFKVHGTITKDVSDGMHEKIILTTSDYKDTEDYRQYLFDRLKADLAEASLVIIGQSLADQDIRDIVETAVKLKSQSHSTKPITLLMYTEDLDRAELMEARGLRVVFGGLDSFFAALSQNSSPQSQSSSPSIKLLDNFAALTPITTDVEHALGAILPNIGSMYNGYPATYSDIVAGLTFQRTLSQKITDALAADEVLVTMVLGASGVGKTTLARQALLNLKNKGWHVWEHRLDHVLDVDAWISVAEALKTQGNSAVVLVDDAHFNLYEINDLIDGLVARQLTSLKVVLTSSRSNWGHRIKSPSIYRNGKEFYVSQLDGAEIDSLLSLIDHAHIRPLIEASFCGFSRFEQKRRLKERCHADMFVCLKNIYASEKFDDIILREYADLHENYQNIYKYVAALETAGVRVHRQLIIRLLNIPADQTPAVLANLVDIVSEYDIDTKEGIYGWRGRHPVITKIIADYKFGDHEKWVQLFDRVIDSISPTYDIEIRSIRELCNGDAGLARIPDKKIQNRILRKLISAAPSERVPRHRLIRNLISMGEFDQAQTEIKIFEKDFNLDSPVARYKVQLMIARATRTEGILLEDRIVILEQARQLANDNLKRYQENKYVLSAYADVGIEIFKLTGSLDVYDDAIARLKASEQQNGDPDISKLVRRYETRVAGQPSELDD